MPAAPLAMCYNPRPNQTLSRHPAAFSGPSSPYRLRFQASCTENSSIINSTVGSVIQSNYVLLPIL